MNYARLLTEGVGGWLQFEGACSRDGLFNEKYLTQSIGQILSANTGNRTLAEFKHPVLAPAARGPGRRPEIDFVVCDPHPTISVAVESKWVGKTIPTPASVVWDLIRLSLLAREGSRCFFVMAGKRSALDAYFGRRDIAGTSVTPAHPVLRHDVNTLHRLDLTATRRVRLKMMRRLYAEYQTFTFPTYLTTRRSQPFPATPPNNRYQAYTWEVFSKPGSQTFRPENSREFRQASSTTNRAADLIEPPENNSAA
ncbi:MAG: hypothetical protein Q8R71_01200 [Phenylobacterium sp.]|nr:hypothetical protein [Phenylobacterium sp.]